jgi:hypothetical protein
MFDEPGTTVQWQKNPETASCIRTYVDYVINLAWKPFKLFLGYTAHCVNSHTFNDTTVPDECSDGVQQAREYVGESETRQTAILCRRTLSE